MCVWGGGGGHIGGGRLKLYKDNVKIHGYIQPSSSSCKTQSETPKTGSHIKELVSKRQAIISTNRAILSRAASLESRVFAHAKTKAKISCAVTACTADQRLCFLYRQHILLFISKISTSCHLL